MAAQKMKKSSAKKVTIYLLSASLSLLCMLLTLWISVGRAKASRRWMERSRSASSNKKGCSGDNLIWIAYIVVMLLVRVCVDGCFIFPVLEAENCFGYAIVWPTSIHVIPFCVHTSKNHNLFASVK